MAKSLSDQLAELKDALDKGYLTQVEHEAHRAKLLAAFSGN
jgi:hypothetical protein